uniref:Amino acid transporter n=1 Tax=Panagrolaimus superbus TaxID=310955 RepID=A0A914YKM5_9BILA
MIDRFRTSINVIGDAFGAGIVDHYCKEQFAQHDLEHNRHLSNAYAHPEAAALLLKDKRLSNAKQHEGGGYNALSTEETPR